MKSSMIRILSASALALLTPVAAAEVVITQVEERSFFSLWLLSLHPQQSMAHLQVMNEHDVSAVEVFDAGTLAGADVVYVSPALDELQLTTEEIDALEGFVLDGGRLIVPGDNSIWAVEFAALAARFDVSYGESFINGVIPAVIQDTDNPIINGPGGVVDAFNGASMNDNLSSTNEDFIVVATWEPGPNAVGYLPYGEGEVVFLSDFNTFDNDMLDMLDNQVLWSNLFDRPAPCPADFDGDGIVNVFDLLELLDAWGDCASCPQDLNGDDVVNVFDLLSLLDAWGECAP
jgi:hypothetical protein